MADSIAKQDGEGKTMIAELVPDGSSDAKGEIVGFAKWYIFRKDWPPEGTQVTVGTQEFLGEGVDVDLWNCFLGGLEKMRLSNVKGPHISLCPFHCSSREPRLTNDYSALVASSGSKSSKTRSRICSHSLGVGHCRQRRTGFLVGVITTRIPSLL
jgi:hypothetical protein